MKYRILWKWVLSVMAVAIVLGACRSPEPTASPVEISPLSTPGSFSSPVGPAETKQGPVFTIDKPVLAGSTQVAGSGPAEVPIRLVDVTEVGRELATTTIDKNGRFAFRLSEELLAGHSVGLQIGRLEGTQFKEEDFLYSDTYYDRALIGVLFDIASVVEP